MPKAAILDDYLNCALQCADWSRLPANLELTVFDKPFADEDQAARELAPFQILVAMRERTRFPASLLSRLPELRLLITTGMRNQAINTQYCKEHGIRVCATRSVKKPVASAAELAWGHILALSKGLHHTTRDVRAGNWQTSLAGTVSGKRLGVVGLGKLGSQVAKIGLAFGMDVLAWSQNLDPQKARDMDVTPVTKKGLFLGSDFISLHLVLSERSRHIVGAEELAMMKPTAYLINAARAGLVDQKALVEALKQGRIAGAGIDVYDTEPVGPDEPLLGLDNVSLTPHMGYVTQDTFQVFYQDALEDLEAWLAGEPVRVLA